jgi:hypothetical protein
MSEPTSGLPMLHSTPKPHQKGSYWYHKSKLKHCMRLEDFPKHNSRGKRWSVNNPLFRKLLCKHYVANYVVNFKRLDKRIYHAYGMYEGVKIHDAFDMYQELYDRFYKIDRTLPAPPVPPEVPASIPGLDDHDSAHNIRANREAAVLLHEEISKLPLRLDYDHYRRQWVHIWRPLRYINYQLRTLARKVEQGQCDEDDLTTRDAAILGDLELATENLRDYLRKRRMPYFQYCPCKNCVIGLWHLTAPHVTGFSR